MGSNNRFGGPPPQQPKVNVDLSDAEDVTCERCNNYTFEEVMLMKKISALVSPTGKEAIVPIPTFACNACGHINKGFLPVVPKNQQAQTPTPEPVKSSLILEK
jgi:predicted nucleic acid-binding Zn ribbon protein